MDYIFRNFIVLLLLAVACSNVYGQVIKNDRIIGGVETAPHEFPWVVYLKLQVDTIRSSYALCSGTLISDQWVMTATNCLPSPSAIDDFTFGYAILGAYILSSTDQEPEQMVVNITDHRTKDDITLLKLQEPITFNDYIRPISLPAIDDMDQHVDDIVRMIGWGETVYGEYSKNRTLMMVNSTVLSNDACQKMTITFVDSNNICTDVEGGTVGSCSDKGGAMMYRKDENSPWIQVGVLEIGQCGFGLPEVHIRVQPYLEWIQSLDTNINIYTNNPPTTPSSSPAISVSTLHLVFSFCVYVATMKCFMFDFFLFL